MLSNVATSIPSFGGLEVAGCWVAAAFLAVLWQCTFVAVLWVVAIVHMAVEVFVAMKPWSGADKDTAIEPLRAVVAVGSTAIRRVVIETIRTGGGVGSGHGWTPG